MLHQVSGLWLDVMMEQLKESKDNVIGVQWHPESVLDMEIFEGFVTKKLQLSIGMISSTEK